MLTLHLDLYLVLEYIIPCYCNNPLSCFAVLALISALYYLCLLCCIYFVFHRP